MPLFMNFKGNQRITPSTGFPSQRWTGWGIPTTWSRLNVNMIERKNMLAYIFSF